MWDWILILSLLFTGIMLIVVEILFVPGTTIVGLFGFAFSVTAIFSAYHMFGQPIGHYVLVSSLLVAALAIYFSFRSEMWLQFANKKAHESKVNEGLLDTLEPHMEGVTVSELKPIGKAVFGNAVYEVTSENGSLVAAGKSVKIVRLKDHRIYVVPLNQL